jgi:hypothetical protein
MAIDFKTDIDGTAFNGITGLASVVSPVNGTAAVGTSTTVARQDHVHGTDTTRAPLASPTFTGTVSGPLGYLTNTTNTTTAYNPVLNDPTFAPAAKYLWHDRFAFNQTVAPTYETTLDNTTWTAGTLTDTLKLLFIGKENQAVPVVTAAQRGCRFTWYSTSFNYSYIQWYAIGITYTATNATKNIIIESSLDGITWTTRHNSTTTTNANVAFCQTWTHGNSPYIRITFLKTTQLLTAEIRLSTIKALSSRWGDQGLGSEYEFPYSWDVNKKMTLTNLNISGVTGGQTLETDASKNVISAAKQTGYNLALSTTATDIKINGTQSLGSLSTLARADHVHPTDTSRAPTASPSFTGNVGIGTTGPASKLAIYSGDDKDTGPIINLGGNAVNQVESGRLRFTETNMGVSPWYQGAFIHYDGSANVFNIGVHNTGDALQSSDVNAISILRSNGNVGIGTTSPAQKLDVVGNIALSGTVDGVDIAAFKTAYDSHTHTFASLTSKPTTLAGFGITDAYTQTQVNSQISAATAALVDSSPATLDTLNELAAALGDDPNFATTTATSIGLKAPLASPSFTGTVVLPSGQALIAPALGTVASGNIAACTGLPIINGTTGTLSAARGGTGVITSTGSGSNVLSTSALLTTPIIGGTGSLFNGATSGAITLRAAAVAGANTLTLPATSGTLATVGGEETLSGKTLTSPVINTPTGLVKGDVGLGNVDNTSDAGKPVSTATQNALNLKATLASPTFTGTVNGISKSMVGLGNVDNTADTAKPVSTAQQTELDLKLNTEDLGEILGDAEVRSATRLYTARTIGGVSFNGTANINLPGVNAAGTQNTSGNAATATNVAYSGLTGTVPTWNQNTTGNAATATTATTATTAQSAASITATANNTTNETTYITFVDGATGPQGIETDTDLTYNPSTNVLTAGTFAGALSGNADTATKLATAVNIGGVSFDGSANIPQRQVTHHSATFTFAVNTKQYIGLLDSDSESTAASNINLPFLAPFSGKLLKIFVRSSNNLVGGNLTLRLEKNALGVAAGNTPPTVVTNNPAAQLGPSTSTMKTYDWTSLSNTINAGDMIFISIASSTAFTGVKIFFTCLWEWDH